MSNYDPPLYVFTSDRYLGCIPIWCHCFNKYWNSDKQVKILGYKKPEYKNWKLPSNIEFISLGEQTPVSTWSTKIREYLLKESFDHVQWCTEDSFLSYPVNFNIYYDLTNELKNDPNIGRVGLTNNFQIAVVPNDEIKKGKDGSIVSLARTTATWRISGTWSIFSRDLFFECMKEDISPWQFESGKPGHSSRYKVIGTLNNWALRTTCSIRTTGRSGVPLDVALKRPLNFTPINEGRDISWVKKRDFPDDTLEELRQLGFIDSENRLLL